MGVKTMGIEMVSPQGMGSRLATATAALLLALGLLGLKAPPASSATNLGGGEIRASLEYTNPGGLPQYFADCKPTTFDLGPNSAATVAIDVKTENGTTGFVGPVTLSGYGRGYCEGASMGGASLYLSIPLARGVDGSQFGCESLRGGFTRVAVDIQAIFGGLCRVNSDEIPVIFVLYKGVFTPTGGSGLDQPGISRPIEKADFAGPFVLMPA